ncbi:MAG TPA: RidA family protein [Gemmatimonadales bacterium]|nr:RidA family protein [Gemmatimonadales bacterium]
MPTDRSLPAWAPIALPEPTPPPAGAYSPAVRAGNMIFVSGQVPKDLLTGRVVGSTVAEQTRQVMANMERALAAAGATLSDLVMLNVYVTDTDHWAEFDAEYRKIMSAPYPTRTVAGAQLRGILVEINGIAVVP